MGEQDHKKPTGSGSPFWSFSLRIYGTSGVPAACLTLQDAAGVDVNLLLFLLFAAAHGRAVTAEDIGHIIASCEDWRLSVVVPLRGVRRFLRDPPDGFSDDEVASLRQRVKSIELESERQQQELLYSTWPLDLLGTVAEPLRAAKINTDSYAGALGTAFDPGAVATLLEAFAKSGVHAK